MEYMIGRSTFVCVRARLNNRGRVSVCEGLLSYIVM
jgi:hypothetical protein